jgi:hypothetical protein
MGTTPRPLAAPAEAHPTGVTTAALVRTVADTVAEATTAAVEAEVRTAVAEVTAAVTGNQPFSLSAWRGVQMGFNPAGAVQLQIEVRILPL